MKLTLEQIQSAVRGVAYVSEENNMIRLHRFTPEQEELYRSVSPEFYDKAFATSGVILEFDTDSRYLDLSVTVGKGSSRLWFVHSIFVNGQPIGRLTGSITPPELCNAGGRWYLGEGQKRVKILFPWSAGSLIRSLELDNDATFVPITKARKIIFFGDSITQGYDAALPEDSYASILANALDGDCLDKAIGGEVFRSALAESSHEGDVDLITVAYGTNDWVFKNAADLEQNARAFYAQLRRNYPQTRIIVMAPVWRGDWQENMPGGAFQNVAALLKDIAHQIGNALFIDCFDFIPHDPAYFSPDVLHPNSHGFRCYGEKLLEALQRNGVI